MFTKKNLKVGMVVEWRDGRKFMVTPINDDIVMVDVKGSFSRLSQYNEEFDCAFHKNLDVMKVWSLSTVGFDAFKIGETHRELLWEREEAKYYLTLSREYFSEENRYLNRSIERQNYFFSSKSETKSFPDIKTQFTLEEANEVKNIIKSSIEVVEIKGE